MNPSQFEGLWLPHGMFPRCSGSTQQNHLLRKKRTAISVRFLRKGCYSASNLRRSIGVGGNNHYTELP